MPLDERIAAIHALGSLRKSVVITYLTSTRDNFQSSMSLDVPPLVYEHLRKVARPTEKLPRIDLFIHSNGGEGIVPWRLVTLIREFCDEFCVLVPNRAFSAATLLSMGADEVVMHPMGMLGPTDPTVGNPFNPQDPNNPGQLLGISVEDVASYFELVKEDVGIGDDDGRVRALLAMTDKVHPLALGNVKRSTSQSRMMGQKLLKTRNEPLPDHEIDQIIKRLTSELYFHGHPISRQEARDDLGLSFVKDATPEVEAAMWSLFELYDEEMKFNQPMEWVDEIIKAGGVPPLGDPNGVTVQQASFGPLFFAIVESAARTDVCGVSFQATLLRDALGETKLNLLRTGGGWTTTEHTQASAEVDLSLREPEERTVVGSENR